MEKLIDAGAPINVDSNGETPLFDAARVGSVSVAKILLQHGADINLGEYSQKLKLR